MKQIDGSSCDDVLEGYSKKLHMSRCISDVLFEWLMRVAPSMCDETLSELIEHRSNNERRYRL
jgi:hypothetical protein